MQMSARQRLGAVVQTGGRADSHIPVEYVNRQGEPVSPTTGRPYDKPSEANGVTKRTRTRTRNRRRLPVKRVGSMFGNLDEIPTDVTRDPPPRACFNCWQQGHSRRECTRPSVARYCNNCGRRGEDLRSCPRCSRAHSEYLQRLQARERGEEVEPEEMVDESLLGGEAEENDDGCDEVLRELIYQDDRAREMRRSGYSQDSYSRGSDFQEQRQAEQGSYRDREEDDYVRRDYGYHDRRRERSSSRQRDRDCEDNYSHSRDNEYRSDFYERRESRGRDEESLYRRRERDRDHEARASRSASRNERKGTSTYDEVDLDADPVQEVLQLAKSIAHLTPETQDLIMRQVMAERKERVRLRSMKKEREEDPWA